MPLFGGPCSADKRFRHHDLHRGRSEPRPLRHPLVGRPLGGLARTYYDTTLLRHGRPLLHMTSPKQDVEGGTIGILVRQLQPIDRHALELPKVCLVEFDVTAKRPDNKPRQTSL